MNPREREHSGTARAQALKSGGAVLSDSCVSQTYEISVRPSGYAEAQFLLNFSQYDSAFDEVPHCADGTWKDEITP